MIEAPSPEELEVVGQNRLHWRDIKSVSIKGRHPPSDYGETEVEEGVWIIGVHALHAEDEADAQNAIDRIRERFESRLRQMETL